MIRAIPDSMPGTRMYTTDPIPISIKVLMISLEVSFTQTHFSIRKCTWVLKIGRTLIKTKNVCF